MWRTSNNKSTEQHFAAQEIKPTQERIHSKKHAAINREALLLQQKNTFKNYTSPSILTDAKNKKGSVQKLDTQKNPSPINTSSETIENITSEQADVDKDAIASINSAEENVTELPKTDSSGLVPNKNTTSMLAKIDRKQEAIVTPEYMTLRDVVTNKLKEKLVGIEDTEKAKTIPSKSINAWDIAGAFARGLSKLTGKKIEIKPQFNAEGNVTAYAFSTGKFEFSRVK
jgi:hypothetical protein